MLEAIILISLALLTLLTRVVFLKKGAKTEGVEIIVQESPTRSIETKFNLFKTLKIALDRVKYLYKPTVLDNLKLAISHPKFLSKGHSSLFNLTIFPPDQQEKVIRLIEESMKNSGLEEYKSEFAATELIAGMVVNIQLFSQDIEFSDKKAVTLKNEAYITDFVGRPKESCQTGDQIVLLLISDKETNQEYVSKPFTVKVIDYAVDHVSKPFLLKMTSIATGLFSLTSFTLAFLAQIDKTFGYRAGTAAALVTMLAFGRSHLSYRRPKDTHTWV